MDSLWNLEDLLCSKVDEIVRKGDISPTEMDNAYKAVKTLYYITCIDAMEGSGEGYDGVSGNWPYQNNAMRRNSRTNYSMANNSMRRNSRTNYSGHDQKEMIMQKIAELQQQMENM